MMEPARAIFRYFRTSSLRQLGERSYNALRYALRGDFAGLLKRAKAICRDQRIEQSSSARTWAILCTPHTLFIGHLLASRLRYHDRSAEVLTKAPADFPHDMYIVISAQMFKHLPPREKRIIYQMEQSVSSRWFSDKYIQIMEHSRAVLDYALINIEYLAGRGIAYPHVFYLPVGADAHYMHHLAPVEKTIDVLFYGDPNSSPRRRVLLAELSKYFRVRVCSEVYGLDMVNTIRAARVVVNLHYYENALLEMPRIQECLSLGTPIVSETAQDQEDYPALQGAITFFEAGNHREMIQAVEQALKRKENSGRLSIAAQRGNAQFTFMFDRFLVAQGFLDTADGLMLRQPIDLSMGRVALSMPETITRHRLFKAHRPNNCSIFHAVRMRPGWVGTGLSYSVLARMALEHTPSALPRLTIIEDDALLPADFEERMSIVHEYLDSLQGKWDVFAGLIAIIHPDTQILNVTTYRGIRFVIIDKMVSAVCNILNRSALHILSHWNPDNRCDQTNTIDKYLGLQPTLSVVVALPYLVKHRDEVHSTLWGFQNTQYTALIKEAEQILQDKAAAVSAYRRSPHSAISRHNP